DQIVDDQQMSAATGQRAAAANEGPLPALLGLEEVRRCAAALQFHAGEDLLEGLGLDDPAHFDAEVAREVVVIGRDDAVLVREAPDEPRRQTAGNLLAFAVPRRHGQDQKAD